jgi:hypothetical protein
MTGCGVTRCFPESARRDGQRPRTQAFQINDHFVGALVDVATGAGLVTP